MKFTIALAIAAFAAGATAQSAFYSNDLNQTCSIGNDGNLGNCVEGKTDGAVDIQAYTGDVLTEGQSLPRGLEARGITCPILGAAGCVAKCFYLHHKPCGGRCVDSWCYCSANC